MAAEQSPFIGGSGCLAVYASAGTRYGTLMAERTVTLIQSRQNVDEVASRPANDNQTPDPTDFSVVDLSSSDDDIVALVRRTERLALAVIIVMAIFLIFAPVFFIAMMYGI
ncbi:MAG: hypothetical protein E5X43_09705 [Mesorhizobium sp.]|uniref:hypothetical protein n=1 Tax=Mesorhizobium sp. TaxID=1871066 RepID=UPI000FE75933|nr:hypothetical protein [Mesorhizobium sp.]RWK55702.1 MAG: hypothetical protein EOR48_10255 [Mesorhizobium sp.]TIP40323.1 MAG: hypothetical protein E5X62_28780 [Mesorhizobium sp.]TJX00629.1 MAG: hypothetical protein E5X43_09705 [Mesorhizobium sp.]